MKTIAVIELPTNLGLKEPTDGKKPGVSRLPDWLRTHNFHNHIKPESVERLEAPAHRNERETETGILNTEAVVAYAVKQAALISKKISENKFVLVLGGDCSVALGSAIALKQHGNYALFYLDGHTDFMDVKLSQTGAVAGMVAAMTTGYGHDKFTNILGHSPYIQQENLWCVGNREYDDDYEDQVRNSSTKYLSLAALRDQGIASCVESFLQEVNQKKLDGFWIHIDVDVLDDEIMPCVDSRTPGGLSYPEFNKIMSLLVASDKLTGLEITILDPDLDPEGMYTKTFIKNFTSTFNEARKN